MPHALSIDDAVRAFKTHAVLGLAAHQIGPLRARHGFNELAALAPRANPRLLACVAFAAALQLCVLFVPFARPLFQIDLPTSTSAWLMLAGLAILPALSIELARLTHYRRQP
jgi:hypothetical protein